MANHPQAFAADFPHHVIQRDNRRQTTFLTDEYYATYLALLVEHCADNEVSIWPWCLMPNHVHLVAVPKSARGLGKALGDTHRR